MSKKTRFIPAISLLGLMTLILAVFFVGNLLTGSVHIPVKEILGLLTGQHGSSEEYRIILFELRLPRSLTAVFAGMALSVSGLQMQTIFRNPLAGPYVLGISAGSSLGVALLVLGATGLAGSVSASAFGNWAIAMAAWAGGAMVLVLILMVSVRVRDIMTILILGILFGSATTALVSILQYFSSEATLKSFIIWTLGSLSGVTSMQLKVLVPATLAGLILAIVSSKQLNVLLLGENYARSLGLNVHGTRILVFAGTAILSGTVTAFCGPIGFIGIAVPHIARLLTGVADHRILIPASMLLGGIFMLLSDIISQLPGLEITLPINSVTALLGIPVVIWIVIRNQKISNLL